MKTKVTKTNQPTDTKVCIECQSTFDPKEAGKTVFRCESLCSAKCEQDYLNKMGSRIWQRGY